MKRVLMVSTVAATIGQFNLRNLELLQQMGYEVHVAADFHDTSAWPADQTSALKKRLESMGIPYHQIDFSRHMLKLNRHQRAFNQILGLLRDGDFSFVHTHTPIASFLARIACKKTKTKVIYTAHGYHFYQDASLFSWLVFYMLERHQSKYTDILVNINEYDYNLSLRHFRAKAIRRIHGVGIVTQDPCAFYLHSDEKRNALGIEPGEFAFLSVGELNDNKNHMAMLRVMKHYQGQPVKYFICGEGENHTDYEDFIRDNKLEKQVILLGFRSDVSEILHAVDCYVFPSIREGLPVSVMEAMRAKLPVLVANTRGCTDLIKDDHYIFNPKSEESLLSAIVYVRTHDNADIVERNLERLNHFSTVRVNEEMRKIYEEIESMEK